MNTTDFNFSVYVKGSGSYLPKKVLTNDDLSKIVDTSDEWIRTRTGVLSRHIAEKDECASDMALKAAEKAIANAKIDKNEIDCIIVGTITSDMIFPSTAAVLQSKLGINDKPAFDISAACSGFIYGLEIGTNLLKSGSYKNILIIGVDKLSSITDWTDRTTCVLFGDGAGAVILSKNSKFSKNSNDHENHSSKADCSSLEEKDSQKLRPEIVDNIIRCESSADASILFLPAGGSSCPASKETVENRMHFINMNGRELFKYAIKLMAQIVLELLEKNNLSKEDVKCLIPHQANSRIIEALAERLQMPMENVFSNVAHVANTSAATIPVALSQVLESQFQSNIASEDQVRRFEKGDHIVLVAFGSGLTYAASLIRMA